MKLNIILSIFFILILINLIKFRITIQKITIESQMFFKVSSPADKDARILPPIQTENFRCGGVTTRSFTLPGTNFSNSFSNRFPKPNKIFITHKL